MLEAHREEILRHTEQREAAIKHETDELKALLEKTETLTREIHARLGAGRPPRR